MVARWVSFYRRSPALSGRSRRLAVAGAFLGYPLLVIGYNLLVAPGWLLTVVWAPIAIVLFGATVVGALAVYGYGQGRMTDQARLDERQRVMADRALIVSYRVLATAVTLGLGFLAIAATFQTIEVHMESLVPWLIMSGLYLPLLPFASLAWIESDAPADEA